MVQICQIKMRKSRRGFRLRLGSRVVNIFRRFLRRKKPSPLYSRLLNDAPGDAYENKKTMTKIFQQWGQRIKRQARELCLIKSSAAAPRRRYRRLGEAGGGEMEAVGVPKGHLAVYVEGQKGVGGGGGGGGEGVEAAERHRFLVPVIYFNHPLFGELLREAEREYGFHQAGGITIPCPVAEFQNVKARVSAACKRATWKHLL